MLLKYSRFIEKITFHNYLEQNKNKPFVIFIRKVILPLIEPNFNSTKLRLNLVIAFFIVLYSLVILRAYNIISEYDDEISLSNLTTNTASFHRANVYDRNGQLLAVDLSVSSIYANPKHIHDHKEVAKQLHNIFPKTPYKSFLKDLTSEKSFIWIKRNATPKEIYAVNKLGIPGIQYESGHHRFYPYGNLLSHVIGYVGIDGMGLAGIEKFFDKSLILDPKEKEPDTKNIQLSLDLRLQYILHEELQSAFEEFKPVGAAGIITDIKTGEILAMVSLPDYDPHNPGKANSEQLFSRTSLASQELGSVFKVLSIAMALDSNTVTMASSYDVNEPIKFARFKLRDYRGKGGIQTLPQIFINSSNIGTAKVAIDMGTDIQKKYMKKFGLFDNLNLEIPEKGQPIFPSDSKWSILSTMTISYGHGMMITPLHFIRAFGGVVNGGKMVPLTLIKYGSKSEPVKAIISTETSEQIKKLLRLNIVEGSGKKANAEGYLVGGKTGSAEKSIKGGYSKSLNLSSFVAAFPINDPKYAVFVLLDEPKGNKNTFGYSTGGWTAAPVVGKTIARIGSLLGIDPIDENDEKVIKKLSVPYYDTEVLDEAF